MLDKETLKSYSSLNYEIYRLEKRIKKLKKQKIEYDHVTGSNPEFPYQPISIQIEGMTDNSERIEKLENILKERKGKAEKQQIEVEEFIANILDSRIRLIFEDRYIFNKSWLQISRRCGSRNESYARMAHDRYLDEVEKWEIIMLK